MLTNQSEVKKHPKKPLGEEASTTEIKSSWAQLFGNFGAKEDSRHKRNSSGSFGSTSSIDKIMQKSNSQSSESIQSDKSSSAKDVFKNLKTKLMKNSRQTKKRLSETEKEQLEYITRLYAEIDPDTPEDRLTEIEKGVVKLKKYFEEQLNYNKPKPIANKEKELLEISPPLEESVMTNDKLGKISQNPLIRPAEPPDNNKSSLIRNEAFFASCERLHLLEPPALRSKSMNDIYFKQDEPLSVCLKHFNTTEDLTTDLYDNVILRPGNSRLQLNITEGTYRIAKSPAIPENSRPTSIEESRNSFTKSMLNNEDSFYNTNSFFYQEPVKYDNIKYENLEYLYSKIDRSRPEESLSKEDRFVLRLKRALDEMGRKNTLRKSKISRKRKLGISGPTKESVMSNAKLTKIINDPNVQQIKKDDVMTKRSILDKIGFRMHKRNSASENVVDAVNENVVNADASDRRSDGFVFVEEHENAAGVQRNPNGFIFSEEFEQRSEEEGDAVSFDDTPLHKIFGSNSSLYDTVILQSPLQKTIAERQATLKAIKSIDEEEPTEIYQTDVKAEDINEQQKTIAERKATLKAAPNIDEEEPTGVFKTDVKAEGINKEPLLNVSSVEVDCVHRKKSDRREVKERPKLKDVDRLSHSLFSRNLDKSEIDLILSYVNTENYVVPGSPLNDREMKFIERAKKEFPETIDEHIYESCEGLKRVEPEEENNSKTSQFKKPIPLPRTVGVKNEKGNENFGNLLIHKSTDIKESPGNDYTSVQVEQFPIKSVEYVSVKDDIDNKIDCVRASSIKENADMESKSSSHVDTKPTGSVPKVPQNRQRRHSSENVKELEVTQKPSRISIHNLEDAKSVQDVPADDLSSDGSKFLRKVPKFLNDCERRIESDNRKEPVIDEATSERHFFTIVPKESTDRSYLELFKSPEEKTYDQISGQKDKHISAPYVNIHFFGGSDDDGSEDSVAKTESLKIEEAEEKPVIVDYVPLDASKPKDPEFSGPSASYDSLERVAALQMFHPRSSSNIQAKGSQDHDKYLDKCELERRSTSSVSSSDSRKRADNPRLSVQDVRKKFEQSASGPVPLPGLDFKYYDTLKRVPKKKNFRDGRKEQREQ